MSDVNGGSNGAAGHGPMAQPQGPQISVLAQYVKDLSFENPHAPTSLQGTKPTIEIGLDVQARPLGIDQYEVVLRVRADAQGSQSSKTFVVELVYAGVFGLRGIPQESIQPILLIECPRLLFPFARRIVGDITQSGGFPPLLLEPIDFAALFRSQMQAQAQQREPGAGGQTELT